MGACHACKCFYCENLGTKCCPLGKVCSTCYKGANAKAYRIIHCDKQKNYDPSIPAFETPRKKPKPKKKLGRKRNKDKKFNKF